MDSKHLLAAVEQMSVQATRFAPKVALATLVLLCGGLLVRFVRRLVLAVLARTNLRPASLEVAGAVVGIASWALVLSIVLSTLQLQAIVLGLSGVLAFMGAAFVASIGNVSNDVLAGFFLASDRDIGVGCHVRAAGIEGTVRAIDLRKTRIVDADGNLHIIPNRLVEGMEWGVVPPPAQP